MDEEPLLDELYAAPLDQFVKVRNDIVGRLKKAGEDAAAARFAALKKPSVSAWAVNQLARSGSIDLQRLIKAGEALEEAQSRAISEKGSGEFESARREESAATSLLRAASKKVVPAASPAVLDRIASTLRAGAATAEGRKLIKQGRLTADLDPPGFGAFSGVPMMESTEGVTSPVDDRSLRQGNVEALRKFKREADAEAKALDREARQLEAEAREAESLAGKAARTAAAARKKADAAAAEAKSIEAELNAL